LHLWYTLNGAKGGSGLGTDSVYTSKPWDGLALVIDSHSGIGGIRVYLNDGQKDFSKHPNPSSLAFAHCNFDYRNKGVLSKVVVSQTPEGFKVEADGKVCLQTDKVRIPRGYYFGLTAATTETPDSFELFNLLVSSPQVGKVDRRAPRDEPRGQQQQQQQQQHQHQHQQQHQPQHGGKVEKLPKEQSFHEWRMEYGEEDHEAAYYKSQEEQFSDVHNRLQALTHHMLTLQTHLDIVYDRVGSLHSEEQEMRTELRNARIPREQIDKMDARLARIENLATQIANAITAKDYSKHFEELRNTLKEHHSNLLYSVPDTVTQVLATGGPKVGLILTFIAILQVGLAGAYVIYKRRRNSSPKKYL